MISILLGLLVSKQRKIFLNKHLYFSALIAFLIFLPNLLWQYNYHFPVVVHMKELKQFQLQYVEPSSFIKDQILMNLPCVFIWLAGLYFLIFKELGKLGMMGVLVPEKYGGAGLGYYEYSSIIQEISKVCGSIGLSVAAHNSLCTGHILTFGDEEQKQKYLPKLATAEFIGAWGLTEPNTGSDAGNMQCLAVKEGEEWIINGTKNWITHGISSDVAVVICRTGEPRTKNNSTAFIVERGTKGFSGGKKENKLGMRASETAEMIFDNCRISDSNRR